MTAVIVAAVMTPVIGWDKRRFGESEVWDGGVRAGAARADGLQRGPADPARRGERDRYAGGRRARAGAARLAAALLSGRQGAARQRGGGLGRPVCGPADRPVPREP